ncbi:MAG: THUMP domain-containing protein [Thermoplasmatota archaeon]
MNKLHVLRYGEIGTKGRRVRNSFESILIDNIERTFLKENQEVIIDRKRGRLYAYCDEDSAYLFSRVFGLVTYSPAEEVSSDMEDIKDHSKKFSEGKEGTFAVRATRTGSHDYSSPQLEAEVGAAVLKDNPDLDVDLEEPDNTLNIEVRNNRAYLFTDKYPCPGGLPLGCQGKIAGYLEDENDFIATWMMMKRGARVYVFRSDDIEEKLYERLDRWDPNLKMVGEGTKDGFFGKKFSENIKGLVIGQTLDDIYVGDNDHELLKSDGDLPVFRPLIGFTDERIVDYLEKIDDLEHLV